jgi:hypothetical protein
MFHDATSYMNISNIYCHNPLIEDPQRPYNPPSQESPIRPWGLFAVQSIVHRGKSLPQMLSMLPLYKKNYQIILSVNRSHFQAARNAHADNQITMPLLEH